MSRLTWVKTIKCDLCGKQHERPAPSSDAEGWGELDVRSPGGRAFVLDLCTTCVALPVHELLAHIRKLDQ